jgi:hypothetical protein
MGWYLRKSFRFGPVRLNLSKSGLGYSFGIKGARIGSGPRGNYIHMGRYGLYYRESLPSSAGVVRTASGRTLDTPLGLPALGTAIATADATTLTDSSAEQLLNYTRHQHEKARLAPWSTAGARSRPRASGAFGRGDSFGESLRIRPGRRKTSTITSNCGAIRCSGFWRGGRRWWTRHWPARAR